MLTFCTIVTPATAAQACVMGESVRAHHSDAQLVAWAPETVPGMFLEPFELVDRPLAGSIPALLRHVLDTIGADEEPVIYLEPTVAVYAPLESLLTAARSHAVVLAERVSLLPDDGERPDDADLARAGRISTALVAVTSGGRDFLDWWARERDDEIDDGRLLEQGRARFSDTVGMLTDPGCAVGHWNLHERTLTDGPDRRPTVDGAPLRSFDFAGFRPDRPYWLSEDATRVRVVGDAALARLCGEHAERLRAVGWVAPRADITSLVRLGNGQRIDVYCRRLWRRAVDQGQDFGDPAHPGAADAFMDWLREAPPEGPDWITRYLYRVYQERPDLQAAFPDLDGKDGPRLLDWAADQAGRETLGELLPTRLGESFADPGARIAVNVIGYLSETFGLAEAARLYVEALQAARVPVSTRTLRPDLPIDANEGGGGGRPETVDWTDLRTSVEPAFNLACLNGDHLVAALRREGPGLLRSRTTIGQWGWETDILPDSWESAVSHLDEVWVYSRFMAENLGRLLPVPVVVIPPPIPQPIPGTLPWGLIDDDRFTFVFLVDLFSTLERKNPGGLVDAFTRAFAEDEGPRLLIKTINAEHRPEAMDGLRSVAQGRGDVTFADVMLDGPAKTALLARADCYVSLHRSEGFGLPLAEAMALGTPVIATGYSGNLDFMSPANSRLVDWTETRVGPGSRIYPAHGHWAEPDLGHAAALLREVWENPEAAADRATRARTDIERRYSPAAVGEIARARLERLVDRPASAGPWRTAGDQALERIESALAIDPGANGGGAAHAYRRLVLRLMRPFTYHERELDRAVLDALRSLQADLRRRSGD